MNDRKIRSVIRKQKNLHEGKGTVYNLISDSQENLETALRMAKKNKKMRPMIASLTRAIEAVRGVK